MSSLSLLTPPCHADRLLTVDDLAVRWSRSPATIRSDASRAPHALPPICRLPGQNRLLWRLAAVEAFERAAETTVTAAPPAPARRRRGRPTKAESLQRRQAEVQHG
jgi:hypothetical protein